MKLSLVSSLYFDCECRDFKVSLDVFPKHLKKGVPLRKDLKVFCLRIATLVLLKLKIRI